MYCAKSRDINIFRWTSALYKRQAQNKRINKNKECNEIKYFKEINFRKFGERISRTFPTDFSKRFSFITTFEEKFKCVRYLY